jgi:hypothetical protein
MGVLNSLFGRQQKENRNKTTADLYLKHKVHTYVKAYVEPIIKNHITDLLSQLTYARHVDIEFQPNEDWEVKMLQSITVGSENRPSKSHLAFNSGRGIWRMIIGGKRIEYELRAEWDVPDGLIAISLTIGKLERLLRGEYVPNVLGEVPHLLPGPERLKIDNSILDDARDIVETIAIKYADEIPLYPLEKKLKTESPGETLPFDKEQYDKLENEMKGAIRSLGWNWKEIDMKRMDQCIRETLEANEEFEHCIKRYLQKEE